MAREPAGSDSAPAGCGGARGGGARGGMSGVDHAINPALFSRARFWATVMLLLVLGLVLGNALWPSVWLQVLMSAGLFAFLALEWPLLPRLGRLLILLGVAIALLSLLVLPNVVGVWLDGLQRAGFYAALFVALAFLREPAERSALVRRCGSLLVNQMPGRRYAALSGGVVLFGTVLNLGAINLLGTMIRRANTLEAAEGRPEVMEARLQRMGLALLRGFATTPLASPLSIAFIVSVSTVPGATWPRVLALGIPIGLLVLTLGWLLDRYSRPRRPRVMPSAEGSDAGPADLAGFTCLVLGIFGLTVSIEFASPLSLPQALLLAAPVSSVLWVAWQVRRAGASAAGGLMAARFSRRGPALFSGLRAEISIISAASFVSVVLAAMIPGEVLADVLARLGAGDMAIVLTVGPVVALLSILGVNPILPVVLLGTAITDGGIYTGSPELLAIAFLLGWTAAINVSPLIPVVMTVSRVIRVPAYTLSLRWNGPFGLCLMVLGGFLLWLIGTVIT